MRAYLIPRLERLLKSTCLSIVVSSVLFASYHLYQGLGSAIGQAATGAVWAASFCWARRLWPLWVAHAATNVALYL